jgi:hypothetical protein
MMWRMAAKDPADASTLSAGRPTVAQSRARKVEKAKAAMLDAAPQTVELFLKALNGEPPYENLNPHTRVGMMMKALEYQLGKPAVAKEVVVDPKKENEGAAEDEPPEEQGLRIV